MRKGAFIKDLNVLYEDDTTINVLEGMDGHIRYKIIGSGHF